jgi:peptidoglycan/xylan/chitin deacetylase (PgdA/CDA1 family)
MYLVTTPWWLRKVSAPGLTWNIPVNNNEVFLTFDDGPHPEITPFVLDCLRQYNAKATFFCIGKNVKQYPKVYKQVIDEDHKVANHTYNHLNGWKTKDAEYINDIVLAKNIIDSKLFRPPYGRISRFQAQQLKSIFKIVMWSVLSADFDVALDGKQCYKNVVDNVKGGSIVVFHDSEKAFPRLEYALPEVLKFLTDKGYKLKAVV